MMEQQFARLLAVFGEPRSSDPAIYIAECERVLVGYEAVMDRVVTRAINECTFFPKPAELLTIAQEVAAVHTKRKVIVGPREGAL